MAKEQHFAHPPRGHVAILAYDDGNNRWQVLECTEDGYLQVRLQEVNGTVLIQQVMPSLLQPGINTHDGATWRKQPLIWGYTDRWAGTDSIADAVAGANTITLPAVPAGSVYVLQALTGLNVNSICSMRFRVKSVAVACTLTTFANQPAATVAAKDYTGLPLKEGDQAQIIFEGCTVNDDLYMVAWGYKMRVNL